MSHVNVFYAIEAPYGAFFTPTGSNKRVCSVVPFAHPVQPTANFCDQCGNKTTMQPIEAATEAFQAFCDAREIEPRFAYHQLTEDGWEWSADDATGVKLTVGLYRVQSVDTPDRRDPRETITALGIKIDSIHEEPGSLAATSFVAEDLARFDAPVREVAEAFKITGTPRLYVQLYVSY